MGVGADLRALMVRPDGPGAMFHFREEMWVENSSKVIGESIEMAMVSRCSLVTLYRNWSRKTPMSIWVDGGNVERMLGWVVLHVPSTSAVRRDAPSGLGELMEDVWIQEDSGGAAKCLRKCSVIEE